MVMKVRYIYSGIAVVDGRVGVGICVYVVATTTHTVSTSVREEESL